MLSHKAGMISGTACGNQDIINVFQIRLSPVQIVKAYHAILIHMNGCGVADCLRLFINFLEHEMRISVLFCRFRSPCHFLNFFGYRKSFGIKYGHLILLDYGDFIIIDNKNTSGLVNNCRNIRSDEVFSFAQADDQRVGFLCTDNGIREIAVHEQKGVCTGNTGCYLADSGEEISVIQFFCQMSYYLGICFRLENMAPGNELLLKFHVIFNNPVMYHYKVIVAVPMRM